MSPPHATFLLLAAALALGLAGCSSAQLYAAGQQWQRNECRRLPLGEQQRCMQSSALSFEDYQKQSAKVRSGD